MKALCMAIGKQVLFGVDYSGHQSSGPTVPDPGLCLMPTFLPEMPIPTSWLNDDIKILMTSLARMLLESAHICLARGEPRPLSPAHIHVPAMAPPVLPAP